MALRAQKNDFPENAVFLTKRQAVEYQWKQIYNWKPQREVWPLKYGTLFLGGLAGLSGIYINYKFRRTMKLRDFGGAVSIFTMTICPGAMTSIIQTNLITDKIVLPVDTCAACLGLKSVLIQHACALGYPLLLTPITNFMLALRGQTHRIPYYKNWRELLTFCRLLYKPMIPGLAALSLVNTFATNIVVYKQIQCISYMQKVLIMNEVNDESSNQDNLF